MLQYAVAPRGDDMESGRTLRGYDPEEVNKFLDKVIVQVEEMIKKGKEKDKKLADLVKENNRLQERLEQYERMQESLKETLVMAKKTSEQVKLSAHQESEMIISDAKKNANRIVNEALLKAEKTEDEAIMLRRNIKIFKKRLRTLIETQLEMVDEIETIEL